MIPFTYALKCSVSNPLETVTDFIFLGSKITADGDCSHEIKRHLLPGRKVMTNLDSILKSRAKRWICTSIEIRHSYRPAQKI